VRYAHVYVHEHIIKLDLEKRIKKYFYIFFEQMEKIAAFLLVEKKQKKQKLVKCSAPLTTDLPLTLDPLRREKKMKNEK